LLLQDTLPNSSILNKLNFTLIERRAL
jgi:hypothetical protein